MRTFRLPILTLLLFAPGLLAEEPQTYRSPYTVKFENSEKDLLQGITDTDRGNAAKQSKIPFDDWAGESVRKKYGSWGPPLKLFDVPREIEGKNAEWQRERVIALALRYRGYTYQHHHLPDWDPPADWPWLEVGRGKNGKGIDCSNFTTFVYNVALGVHFSSDVRAQSVAIEAKIGEKKRKIEIVKKTDSFAACAKLYKPGDLLFIKNKDGKVSHVVMWVGAIGGPDSLILDSTGTGHNDKLSVAIPDGVQLRPFTEKGWYFQSLSHGHRIVPD